MPSQSYKKLGTEITWDALLCQHELRDNVETLLRAPRCLDQLRGFLILGFAVFLQKRFDRLCLFAWIIVKRHYRVEQVLKRIRYVSCNGFKVFRPGPRDSIRWIHEFSEDVAKFGATAF